MSPLTPAKVTWRRDGKDYVGDSDSGSVRCERLVRTSPGGRDWWTVRVHGELIEWGFGYSPHQPQQWRTLRDAKQAAAWELAERTTKKEDGT